MSDNFQYEGTIEKIYFQKKPDFTIGALREEGTRRLIRFIGTVPDAHIGQAWRIEGVWQTHKTYGEQLAISASQPVEVSPGNQIEKFFASSTFRGIGPKLAHRIVETLGDGAVDIILKDESVLKTKCGLSDQQCLSITGPLKQLSSKGFQVSRFLKWGLDQSDIRKLETIDHQMPDRLEQDPFWPFYHVQGFGYESCRKIADGLLLAGNDIRRVEAEIFRLAVQFIYSSGSTSVPLGFLKKRSGLTGEQLETILDHLKERGLIITVDNQVYLIELYQSELAIANEVCRHLFFVEKQDPKKASGLISWASRKRSIQYDLKQREAIETFLNSPMMILNGGPGTGKSTLLVGLLDVLGQLYPSARIKLCAPTGRAAKRMNEVTGRYASTIHSLLHWDKEFDSFEVNESNPLNTDFLIVDEFSMVDTRLFASLLKALPEQCRILLIGDEDQLESVGPGNVMRDLIQTQAIPVVRLETIHRQKEGSGIPQLARQIKEGLPVEFADSVEFLKPQGTVLSCIRNLVSLEEDAQSIQILAPKYDGESGIFAINSMMQELVNPFSENKPQLVLHHTTSLGKRQMIFRVDDKVLLKKNMAEQDVFNGDIGRITHVDEQSKTVFATFGEAEIEIERSDLNAYLSHAWCISIHKSQGSEYQKACVVVDSNGAGMLQRRLLYTAISRAKKQLTIVGDEALFRLAALDSRESRRITTLKKRILQLMNHEEGWEEIASAKRIANRYVLPENKMETEQSKDKLDELFDSSQEFSLE